jgi:hypothetical protein
VRLVVALPGALTTLRVYVVRPHSASGLTPGWPTQRDGFVVVRVPQAGFPVRPVVVQSERVLGVVRLRVSKPPLRTAKVGRYELYRTQDSAVAASGDFRRMRLVASRQVVDADWQPWTWFDDDFECKLFRRGACPRTSRRPRAVATISLHPCSMIHAGGVAWALI